MPSQTRYGASSSVSLAAFCVAILGPQAYPPLRIRVPDRMRSTIQPFPYPPANCLAAVAATVVSLPCCSYGRRVFAFAAALPCRLQDKITPKRTLRRTLSTILHLSAVAGLDDDCQPSPDQAIRHHVMSRKPRLARCVSTPRRTPACIPQATSRVPLSSFVPLGYAADAQHAFPVVLIYVSRNDTGWFRLPRQVVA